jgi:hypothetical protein
MSGHAEHHGDDHGSDHGGPGILTKLTQVRGGYNHPTSAEVVGHAASSIIHTTRSSAAAVLALPFAAGTLALSVPSNLIGKASEMLNYGARTVNDMGASLTGGIAGKPPSALPRSGGGHDHADSHGHALAA